MAKKHDEAGSARCADRTSQRDVPTAKLTVGTRSIGGASYTSPKSAGHAEVRTRLTRPSDTKRPFALGDTRVICCGDNLEQLKKLQDACIGRFFKADHAVIIQEILEEQIARGLA